MVANEEELRKLKVVDLKALLKEKGLSTAGVKEELVQRLVESEAGTNGADAEAEAVNEDRGEAEEPAVQAEIADQDTEKEPVEAEQKEPEPEQKQEQEQEKEKEQQVPASEPDQSQIPSEDSSSKRKAEDIAEPDQKRIKVDASGREERVAIHPTTRALYVGNLTRPVQKRDFVDYVTETTGHNAEYAWVDRLRTHGFFVFKDEAAAQNVRRALDQSRYPQDDNSRVELFADFVPENLAYKWSKFEDEEKNRNQSKKYAVRYEEDDDGKIIAVHYEKPEEEPASNKRHFPVFDPKNLKEVQWTKTQPSVCFAERI